MCLPSVCGCGCGTVCRPGRVALICVFFNPSGLDPSPLFLCPLVVSRCHNVSVLMWVTIAEGLLFHIFKRWNNGSPGKLFKHPIPLLFSALLSSTFSFLFQFTVTAARQASFKISTGFEILHLLEYTGGEDYPIRKPLFLGADVHKTIAPVAGGGGGVGTICLKKKHFQRRETHRVLLKEKPPLLYYIHKC